MSVSLLIVSAVIEFATGVLLLAAPEPVVALLLGGSLDTPTALVAARVAGAALLSLGSACWLARRDGYALVAAMLVYNVAATAVMMHAYFGFGLNGTGLWPAIILHSALVGWCLKFLQARKQDAK